MLCTHWGLVCRDLPEAVCRLVVDQPELALAVEGDEEGDVVGLAVLPRGGDAQVPQHPGHREVEAGVPYEEEGPVDCASHQSQEALADSGSCCMGHLGEDTSECDASLVQHLCAQQRTWMAMAAVSEPLGVAPIPGGRRAMNLPSRLTMWPTSRQGPWPRLPDQLSALRWGSSELDRVR